MHMDNYQIIHIIALLPGLRDTLTEIVQADSPENALREMYKTKRVGDWLCIACEWQIVRMAEGTTLAHRTYCEKELERYHNFLLTKAQKDATL